MNAWYAGRDSLHYGVAAVQPSASKCPPDICILWFESLRLKYKSGKHNMVFPTFGASVLIGLFKKRCHTNGFSDFRVADFLVFTLQAVPEVPKSKPTS